MSIGVPIYLVSACATGEEFVAAFRRYADRSGLFIPIADPIPVGKRGRFAVTLTDGAVMVEGEAEVVSSTRTPSVLHGRIGMTLRFSEPDEPSKVVLVELEKARLSMKPPPPSVPPRPAVVPAEPRPVAPPTAGRIDASNALAECVAIGDLVGLEAAPAAPKASTKFVMPSVAPVPEAQRSRSPSAPPLGLRPRQASTPPLGGAAPPARPKQPTAPPPKQPAVSSTQPSAVVPPPGPPPPLPFPPSIPSVPGLKDSGGVRQNATVQMPSLLRSPGMSGSIPVPAPISAVPSAPIVAEARPAVSGAMAAIEVDEPTDLTEIPIDLASPELAPVRPSPTPTPAPAPQPAPAPAAVAKPALAPTPPPADRSERVPRRTVLGIAVVPGGMTVLPAPTAAEAAELAAAASSDAASEPTGPHAPTVEEPTPSGNWTITPGADKPTLEPRTSAPAAAARPPSGPLTGDWSIAVLPESPDGWSEPSKVEKRAHTVPGPPVSAVASTKDVDASAKPEPVAVAGPSVQIDPSLVESAAPVARASSEPPAPMPRPPAASLPYSDGAFSTTMAAVAPPTPPPAAVPAVSAVTAEPAAASAPVRAPTPAPVPVAASASAAYPRALSPVSDASGSQSGSQSGPLSGSHPSFSGSGALAMPVPTPPTGVLANGSQSAYPVVPRAKTAGEAFSSTGFETAYVQQQGSGRSRTAAIAIGVLLAIGAGAAVFFLLRGRHHAAVTAVDAGSAITAGGATRPTATDAAPAPVPANDAALALTASADAGSASAAGSAPDAAGSTISVTSPPDGGAGAGPDRPVTPDAAVALAPDAAMAIVAATDCPTTIDTSPGGVDIVVAGDVVGTTPATITLRCGVETRLLLRKPRYASAVRTITPKPGGKTIHAKLDKVTFIVKLSSSPPGATVSVGGKSIGVTPTTARLPAFEATTVVFSKPGYASETQKFTAKQNNQTIHSPLKKKGK